jgi:hypothetical protein
VVKATEIRLYVEGGGNSESRKKLRKSFRAFLEKGEERIKRESARLRIIFCGSKSDTYDNFKYSLSDHRQAFNILLVDSDGPKELSQNCWQYLGWNALGTNESHCHLIVQEMEAWFIADIETLKNFYGRRLKEKAIRNHKVEEIANPKEALRKACQDTYHEIDHAADLLGRVDAAKVRKVSPHCNRLFETLATELR